MAARRLSVRKTKEIIRLAHEAGLSRRQIARSLQVSPTTVGECLKRAEAAGIAWPLPEEADDEALEVMLYGEGKKEPARPMPEMAYLCTELSRRGVTLRLLWSEYADEHPEDHYSYPQFCNIYRTWARGLEVSMRQVHRAGEKTFVDWAGQGIPVVDASTGEVIERPVFVAALGASSYTYAEACPSQELPHWTGAHTRAFSFFGGVSRILVPDNTKTGVTHPCRYELDLNPTYAEMAAHFGCAVIPARVRKPKDKAKVESAVLQVERWVIAPLRGRTFFSLTEANRAIRERLEFLNNRKMAGLDASRRELYETLDLPALLSLPQRPYEYGVWREGVGVNIDYHISVEGHFYSVPYQLTKKRVDVRLTAQVVEIFYKGKRVASHPRSHAKGKATTQGEHRPASHSAHLEWTPSRIVAWARETGPATAELASEIMRNKPHPEMGYRACLGIIRLGKKYGPERVEAAAARALSAGAASYKSVKSMLASGLDQECEEGDGERPPLPSHPNLRGPDYYN